MKEQNEQPKASVPQVPEHLNRRARRYITRCLRQKKEITLQKVYEAHVSRRSP